MDRVSYYQIARQASSQVGNHPGLLYLKKLIRSAKEVLDVGCGEGTRLNTLLPQTKKGAGVDIDAYALKLAKKQYPRHRFLQYKGQRLPFEANRFDLVYSAFVIEHTQDPQLFLNEQIRVLKPGGYLVVLAPNYGAPNRRSPNSTENAFRKLLYGLLSDLAYTIQPRSRLKNSNFLGWTPVTPQKTYSQIDADTTVEPYLLSLLRFLASSGPSLPGRSCRTFKSSSLWELEPLSLNPRKLIIMILGRLNLFPFRYWGPQIFLVAQK